MLVGGPGFVLRSGLTMVGILERVLQLGRAKKERRDTAKYDANLRRRSNNSRLQSTVSKDRSGLEQLCKSMKKRQLSKPFEFSHYHFGAVTNVIYELRLSIPPFGTT
jgi:hypothetical protein